MLNKLKYGTFVYSNIIENGNNNYYYYKRDTPKTTVIVVGCGGTGGRLIPMLAQHIANHNRAVTTEATHKQWIKHEIGLVLIDMDIVNS